MQRFLMILFLLAILVSACRPTAPVATSTPILPTSTETLTPAPTLTLTATRTPTVTPTPTRTPLPPILTTNLAQLVRLGSLAGGHNVSASPDSQFLALRTDTGIDLYHYLNLEKVNTFKQTAPQKATGLTATFFPTLTFSPDGKTLAAAAEKGAVLLWDVGSGNLLKTLSGLDREITALAFWPGGQFIYATAADSSLTIWDIASGSILNRSLQKGRGISIAAAGGNYITFADPNGKFSLQGSNGEIVLPIKGRVDTAALSPDGKKLVTGGDGSPVLWDTVRRQVIATLSTQTGPSGPMAFSPDGQLIVTCGKSERVVRLWDAISGKQLHTFSLSDSTIQITFTPDNSTLLVGLSSGRVDIWTLSDPRRPTLTHVPTATPRPTLTRTLIAQANLGTPIAMPSVAINPTNANQITELGRWQKSPGIFLAFIANGQALLAAGENSIDIHNTLDGKVASSITFTNSKTGLQSTALSLDGKLFAASADAKAAIWRLTSPTNRQALNSIDKCRALAFTPDDQALLCDLGDGGLTLVELASGKPQRTFSGAIKNVTAAAFSPDGKTLAAAGSDGNGIVWEAATAKAQRTFSGFSGWGASDFQFSPDSQFLAYTTQTGLTLLNLSSGTLVNLPEAQKPAFSPDGQLLAAVIPNGLGIWKVAGGQLIHTISVNNQVALAFSPDGKLLASAQGIGYDLIRIWGVSTAPTRATGQAPTPTRTATTALATSTPAVPLAAGWPKTYGFEVTYPQPIKGYAQGKGIVLLHSVAHPHTDPCNLRTVTVLKDLTDFNLYLEIIPASLEEAKNITRSGTVDNDNATLGPLSGGIFGSYGVEGCGQDVYLFPLGAKKTLWIVRRWVAEFSPIMSDAEEHLALPGIIPPTEADKLFQQIMATFKVQ